MNITLFQFISIIYGPVFLLLFFAELTCDFQKMQDDIRSGKSLYYSIYGNMITIFLFFGFVICTFIGDK